MAKSPEPTELSPSDWNSVAQFIRAEKQRREGNRSDLERMWAEVDRQIAMKPKPREIAEGDEADWLPNTELPLQANALEVIAADARSLKFPRGADWFDCTAELTQDYAERWERQRDKRPLVAGIDTPTDLDQETADLLCKATMDHFHRSWDFRGAMDLVDAECIKYGTAIPRVRAVRQTKFAHDFRGVTTDQSIGPALIPNSIKNTYLDDTPSAVMHEGMTVSPSIIRKNFQRLSDLKRAAKTGGPSKGWIGKHIARLREAAKTDGQKDQVELLEFEGDLTVPKSRGSIFLPNSIVTVAVMNDVAQPVRFQENLTPFRSYLPFWYMREDPNSSYGTSPLMKGQPIQEAATLAFNMMMASASLNALPPISYDNNDPHLKAMGGPLLYPNARWPSDAPNATEVVETGKLGEMLNVYLALLKQYEDLTGANDPRRGQPAKSHTTAGSSQLEATRSLARTDDFVISQEQGSMTSLLYMEWQVIRETMTKPTPILVQGGGIDGFVVITKDDLPETVDFRVSGSAGAIDEREKSQAFFDAANFHISVATAAAQLGEKVVTNWEEIIAAGYERAGVENANKFTSGVEQLPPDPQAESGVQAANNGADGGALAQLQGAAAG